MPSEVTLVAGILAVIMALTMALPQGEEESQRAVAEQNARYWVEDNAPDDWAARITCQLPDRDGDGYVSCTVRAIDLSSYSLYCPMTTDRDYHSRLCYPE